MSVPEIEELLGAYALDALEPDERAIVDEHLVVCPRCRAELAGHLEVAALLGNTGAPAPDGLWDRIAASLEEAPPAMRLTVLPPVGSSPAPTDELAPRRRRVNRVLAMAVAAAVVVIAGLAVVLVRQEHRIDQMAASISTEGMQGDVMRAMADPASHKMMLSSTSTTGEPMTAAAVMTEHGTGYFMAGSMPALGEDQTYQLWGKMADGQVVSLGVLGHDPQMASFEASGGLTDLMVTEEVRGGVAQSANPAVLHT